MNVNLEGDCRDLIPPAPRWHILLCEPSREGIAAQRLKHIGLAPYVPMIPRKEFRSFRTLFGFQRRQYRMWRPLFPGYLFSVLQSIQNLQSLYALSGLRNATPYLVIDGKRATLSAAEVQSVRRIESALRNPVSLGLPFQPGDRVRILEGPLRDVCGEILRMNNAEHIELLVHMLGGEARVWVSARKIMVD